MARRTNLVMDTLRQLLSGEITVEDVHARIENVKVSVEERAAHIRNTEAKQAAEKALLRMYREVLRKYELLSRPRGQYIRASIHTIDEVFSLMGQGTLYTPDGQRINTESQRYYLFKEKGTRCVTCGVEGKYFAKEKHRTQDQEIYHFNLYAITDEGKEVLMTKDHIKPKSKGGSDTLDNLQPMCSTCNCNKSDKWEEGDAC